MLSQAGAITHVRPRSKRLFLLFTGARGAIGVPTVTFVQRAKIADANFAVFRDPYRAGYQRGISEEHGSLDGIVDWVRARLDDTFAHVEHVYSIGNSAGGTPAIHVGHKLDVHTVFSLAGLVTSATMFEPRDRIRRALRLRFLGREEVGQLTKEEFKVLLRAEQDPEVMRFRDEIDQNPDVLLDRALLQQLVNTLTNHPGRTQYRFYFVTMNALDRLVAESFAACPNVTLYPLLAPWGDVERPWSRLASGPPSHAVVEVLAARRMLSTLFEGLP